MFMDELERLENKEKREDPRRDHRLLPIDSYSQLDTGYTGRPDTDIKMEELRIHRKAGPRIP